jgi:hypothetical protein
VNSQRLDGAQHQRQNISERAHVSTPGIDR